MLFELTEVKSLGKGTDRSLSLRLEESHHQIDIVHSKSEANSSIRKPDARYTIHAVVPYSSEFGRLQIGQTFLLTRIPCPVFNPSRLRTNDEGETINFSSDSVDKRLAEAQKASKMCDDVACPLLDIVAHAFGEGCRLWKSIQWEQS